MLVVLNNGGKQYLVKPGDIIRLEKINTRIGDSITLTQATCITETKNLGKKSDSFLKKAYIKAEIVAHHKDKKITLFKKKRRKGYCKLQGHRQQLTLVKINTIEI